MFRIYCDALQEGIWFKNLDGHFVNAKLAVFPNRQEDQQREGLAGVLRYDRPDIILKDDDRIIFVLERTIEVPSGHNVGQRFGRLVAAAEEHVPVVYFGPYAAHKHGGITSGPRYMNLRLFSSLQNLSIAYNTAVTTINWPVDQNYEILKVSGFDSRVRLYLWLFFQYYDAHGFNGLTEYMAHSSFQQEQYSEQRNFALTQIRNPEQYDAPPTSVSILARAQFEKAYGPLPSCRSHISQIVFYNVGMQNVRSDPYAGMAALYYFCIAIKTHR